MDIQAVTYRGRTVAACTRERFFLCDELQARPSGDPELMFVLAMVLYAHDIAHGHLPGPYSHAEARRYARAFLIPAEILERDQLDIERAAAWLTIPACELIAARLDHRARAESNPTGACDAADGRSQRASTRK